MPTLNDLINVVITDPQGGDRLVFLDGMWRNLPYDAPNVPFTLDGVLYGPNFGPKGPTKFLISVWNQAAFGYCYETNNLSENLYARWKARGVNTIKVQHPAFPSGPGAPAVAILSEAQAQGMMMIAAPRWQASILGANEAALDYRETAMQDAYWRNNWISYAVFDEPDLIPFSLSEHETFFAGHTLNGVTKPGSVNFTWRIASVQSAVGTASINWKSFVEAEFVRSISHDFYSWHINPTTVNAANGDPTQTTYHLSTFNTFGPYNTASPSGSINRMGRGRRFMSSVVGMAVNLSYRGPMSPGFSNDGGATINAPGDTSGQIVLPQPLSYAPGDKSVGHYVATGRIEYGDSSFFPRAGLHQPPRFLRDDCWSGVVHGSSHLLLFPQTVGTATLTGYVDAAANQLVVTGANPRPAGSPANIGGALTVRRADTNALVGWIRRDNPYVSGSNPGGVGTYALDATKAASVNAGTAGAPIALRISAASGPQSDDTNPANAAEITNVTANLARMQAHPQGGNLLINPVVGGRRAFTVLRCPAPGADPSLYREDMTLCPVQAGYSPDGTPVLDSAGEGPMWQFGWPMGFEGWHVTGDDGAVYIYIKSMSNGNAPTWFPGFAALGLPARLFGPFELVGFRRVGSNAAVEMNGESGVIKAGVDDGAATWFFIDSEPVVQPEGNSGTTTFNVTIRRGGDLSGSNAVTATVSGAGTSQANAADFVGGTFPTQTFNFAAGETAKTFAVAVQGDTSAEQNDEFAVTLSAPTNGAVLAGSGKHRVVCTITNDDEAVSGAFVWLVKDLTSAPALSGAPTGGVHLRGVESSNVTRAGITMRSAAAGQNAYDNDWFATTPGFLFPNSAGGALFELAAGNWEIALVMASAPWGGGISGTIEVIDDPIGAASVRQTIVYSKTGALLTDTTGLEYRNATTAVGDVVNNLTWLPVTVTNLDGGNGLVRVRGGGGNGVVAAIALRQT